MEIGYLTKSKNPFLSGRLYDKIVISHNNQSFGRYDMDESIKAFLVQIGLLYVFNASYENGLDGKKTPDNIRYVFQFIFEYFFGMRMKQSTGTGADVKLIPQRLNAKVKELYDKW